jgi:thymidylate kinase
LQRLSLVMPDLVLMLDVAPEVSMERIRRRGGQQQVHETEEKLARLRAGYLLVCDAVRSELHVPARILDGEAAPAAVTKGALTATSESRPGGHGHAQ